DDNSQGGQSTNQEASAFLNLRGSHPEDQEAADVQAARDAMALGTPTIVNDGTEALPKQYPSEADDAGGFTEVRDQPVFANIPAQDHIATLKGDFQQGAKTAQFSPDMVALYNQNQNAEFE